MHEVMDTIVVSDVAIIRTRGLDAEIERLLAGLADADYCPIQVWAALSRNDAQVVGRARVAWEQFRVLPLAQVVDPGCRETAWKMGGISESTIFG